MDWLSIKYTCNIYVKITILLSQAFEELEKLLGDRGFCVAVKQKLTKDSGVAGARAYEHIVEKLREKPKAKGKLFWVTLSQWQNG